MRVFTVSLKLGDSAVERLGCLQTHSRDWYYDNRIVSTAVEYAIIIIH